MPRLTTTTYLSRHHELKQIWAENPGAFSYLTLSDQRDLHKFFLLSLDKTDAEFRAHRRNVLLADPSLAQRARQSLRQAQAWRAGAYHTFAEAHDGRRIYLHTVMRPQPDVELLAHALYRLAEQKNRKKPNDEQDMAA